MQAGQIKKRGKSWVLRFWETVLVDGKPVRRRVLKRLGPVEHSDRKPPEEITLEAARMLKPVNAGGRPTSVQTLTSFVEDRYLPYVKAELKPSTYASYKVAWALISPHVGKQHLRAYEVPAVNALLRAVDAGKKRANTTHRNVRNFLRGVFREAIGLGLITQNPAREAKIPRGLPKGKTHAYTLDEIRAMLDALPAGPVRTAIVVAGFTGLRVSEIKGLQWSDIIGNEIHVNRGVWQGHVRETKTLESAAPVPMLSIVNKALAQHRKTSPSQSPYIFAGERSPAPLRLENVMRRHVRPLLPKSGIQWRRLHGVPRALGTNLHGLGEDDLTIQRILRHGDAATTQESDIKTTKPQGHAAMRQLEAPFTKARRQKKVQ